MHVLQTTLTADVLERSVAGGLRTTEDVFTIVVAETHAIVRGAVQSSIESDTGLRVAGQAADATEVLELVVKLRPNLLLFGLPVYGSSVQVLAALQQQCPETNVVLFSSDVSRSDCIAALQVGVRGVIAKEVNVETLLRCIRCVLSGQYWVERQLLADAVRGVPAPRSFGLSARELDIVGAVVSGACNKEIAQRLNISDLTVKRHLTNIYEKVGVSGRLELALFALSNNLVMARKPVLATHPRPDTMFARTTLQA